MPSGWRDERNRFLDTVRSYLACRCILSNFFARDGNICPCRLLSVGDVLTICRIFSLAILYRYLLMFWGFYGSIMVGAARNLVSPFFFFKNNFERSWCFGIMERGSEKRSRA